MTYNVEDIEDVLEEYGEIEVVLDSGVEYELHLTATTFDADQGVVSADGWHADKGENLHVEFPASAVEHWYAHDTL